MVLLQGPRMLRFLVSEVTLQRGGRPSASSVDVEADSKPSFSSSSLMNGLFSISYSENLRSKHHVYARQPMNLAVSE